MTTPPEGYHPDPKGDNCKVKIEGVYVTVAQLVRLYRTSHRLNDAYSRHIESRFDSGSVTNHKYFSTQSLAAEMKSQHDAARKEAGL